MFACSVVLFASCSPFVLDQTGKSGAQDAESPIGADATIAYDTGAAQRTDATDSNDAGVVMQTDARVDAAVTNLHPQGSFGGGDCRPWLEYQATLTYDNRGFSKAGSCQVASNNLDSTRYFAADDHTYRASNTSRLPVELSKTYRVSAWVKNCLNQLVADTVAINARILKSNLPYNELQNNPSLAVKPTGNWQRVAINITVDKPGDLNVVLVGLAPTASGACFLFDDVVVERVP
jgi:hypothetical protein